MSEDIPDLRHEFFSWRGFFVGGLFIGALLVIQSYLGFPQVWQGGLAVYFVAYIITSCIIVGLASGSVLVFLIPPDQDVIGVAGLGSDDISQHIALFLVILALIFPELFGFILFYTLFLQDPFAPIWVLVAFAAPSAGLTVSMFDRLSAIERDLRQFFRDHDRLDLTELEWLHEFGARTPVYRMGMIETAARRIEGLRVRGSLVVKDPQMFRVETTG